MNSTSISKLFVFSLFLTMCLSSTFLISTSLDTPKNTIEGITWITYTFRKIFNGDSTNYTINTKNEKEPSDNFYLIIKKDFQVTPKRASETQILSYSRTSDLLIEADSLTIDPSTVSIQDVNGQLPFIYLRLTCKPDCKIIPNYILEEEGDQLNPFGAAINII